MNDTTQNCPRCGAPNSGRGMGGGGMGRGNGSGGMGGRGRGMGRGGIGPGTGATPATAAGHPDAGFGFADVDRTAHRAAHVAQIRADIAAAPRGVLSAEELDDLLLMREEEKIARDVYIRMYEQWGMRPFGNISGAEQAHMDAMLALLEHYGEPDPAHGLAVGQFRRTDLQALHDDLVGKGLQSPAEAVRVGLLIEELDIADLQKAARRTDKPEIRAVYAELERGSRNHLRAFHRWMQMLGIDYQPQHLSAAEFERTALSAHETCA
jgi:hypothetical protein